MHGNGVAFRRIANQPHRTVHDGVDMGGGIPQPEQKLTLSQGSGVCFGGSKHFVELDTIHLLFQIKSNQVACDCT